MKELRSRKAYVAAGIAVLVAGSGVVWWLTYRAPAVSYLTAPVTRGDVTTTITASGSVNPVTTVQVGTYVSGTITSLACDYNTRVRRHQLCAKIDPAPYEIVVEEDRADVEAAMAQLAKDQANADYAKLASDRASLLFKEDSGSREAADNALSVYNQATASVRLDSAQIAQRSAALKAAKINLGYTDIVSPVDGTVVSRNVTAGQTVAASLQTPTLFLIAADLTKMQVDTNVSESDIAGALPGASATFTVDAFPAGVFHGTVAQVRQAPVSVQNVITYDVVLTVDNSDLRLKPGMTATARIATAQALHVLRVPSQALRFTPRGSSGRPTASHGRRGQQVIWVMRAGKLMRVPIVVGLDDDTYAEIRGGDIRLSDQVVTGHTGGGSPSKSATVATPRL